MRGSVDEGDGVMLHTRGSALSRVTRFELLPQILCFGTVAEIEAGP